MVGMLKHKGFTNEEIHNTLGYAYSTITSYEYKARNFIENYEKRKRKQHYQTVSCVAYLLICYDNNTLQKNMIKVGFTQRELTKRLYEIERDSRFGFDYEIVSAWEFNNVEDGYEMEIWLHRYYKEKGYQLVGNDHFSNVDLKNTNCRYLDFTAEMIKENSKEWLDNLE